MRSRRHALEGRGAAARSPALRDWRHERAKTGNGNGRPRTDGPCVEVIIDPPQLVSAAAATSPDEARLPSTLPCIPGLDIAAGAMLRMPSDDGGGGEFLDVLQQNGGFSLSIGAVSGRGPMISALGKLAKFTLQTESLRAPGVLNGDGRGPASVDLTMRAASSMLSQAIRREAELSVLHGYYDTEERCLTFCNCSQWPPALISNGAVTLLEERHSQTSQQWHREYPPVQLVLSPGDTFVAFTDGLPEARRGRGMLGIGPIRRVLEEHPADSAEELIHRLIDLTGSFCNGEPRATDAVVLVARAVDDPSL